MAGTPSWPTGGTYGSARARRPARCRWWVTATWRPTRTSGAAWRPRPSWRPSCWRAARSSSPGSSPRCASAGPHGRSSARRGFGAASCRVPFSIDQEMDLTCMLLINAAPLSSSPLQHLLGHQHGGSITSLLGPPARRCKPTAFS